MCGIVGYVGNREALPILIQGIKCLEYRGYDSAGVAIINNEQKLVIHKCKGKIVDLERSFPKNLNFQGNIGISHTRWATHGKSTEENAHPHTDCTGNIALVHNGIIENYKKLRAMLKKEGHRFVSETDTEILAHLIEKYYNNNNDLHLAVQCALNLVQGTFGIVVIDRANPQKIVAARRGSPLIIGIGNGENFVASDVSALISHTKSVIYLDDNETVEITKDRYIIKNLENAEIEKEISSVSWDVSDISKKGFNHFMLKEIFEQPESITNAFRGRFMENLDTARLGGLQLSANELLKIKHIQIVACGTSWHAGLIGKYLLEDIARIPVKVEYASEYRYHNPVIPSDTLVIAISQSGETADTLAALREAKARGAKVIGITNVIGSTIARETDSGSYIHAGAEIGVASTKAFTSQITILILLSIILGRMKSISPMEGREYIEELKKIPDKVQHILDKNDEIREIAKIYKHAKNALYLGRGVNFPVALEGALKLKEISYVHAEGYPAAEMKHGPIALIDKNMPVFFIVIKDFIHDKVINNMEEVKARSGKIIAIANENDIAVEKLADSIITIPKTLSNLSPLLTVIPLQLLAYHIAVLRGCNVDQPRNLAKSVTVE
ncbi:MAG: glutamine--fructose-6-phosphate transaminase (isomerizing) [Candidatus Cloacimonadota bacterium]|nr:MAG: glutamine--fructose-6-phosphate transaminase (isomerizing) [Candidatus Cloacimonadota bacterium]